MSSARCPNCVAWNEAINSLRTELTDGDPVERHEVQAELRKSLALWIEHALTDHFPVRPEEAR